MTILCKIKVEDEYKVEITLNSDVRKRKNDKL